MLPTIFSLVLATIVGGILWLLLGNRFKLHKDDRQNDILNLALLMALSWPAMMIMMFCLVAPA